MGKQDKKQLQSESESEESDFEDMPEKKVKLNRKKKTDKKSQKTTKKFTKSPQKNPAAKPASTANSKKLFFAPGQKYASPSDSDGTRIFYESLLGQNPKSLMAKKWCLEYGLLGKDKAFEVMNDLKKSSKIKK